jgi:hypothetical protein
MQPVALQLLAALVNEIDRPPIRGPRSKEGETILAAAIGSERGQKSYECQNGTLKLD